MATNERNIIVSAEFDDKLTWPFKSAASKMSSAAAWIKSDVNSKLDWILAPSIDTSAYNNSLSKMETKASWTKSEVNSKLDWIEASAADTGAFEKSMSNMKEEAKSAADKINWYLSWIWTWIWAWVGLWAAWMWIGISSYMNIIDAQKLLQASTWKTDEEMKWLNESLANVAKLWYTSDLWDLANVMWWIHKESWLVWKALEEATATSLAFQKSFPDSSREEFLWGSKNVAAEYELSLKQSMGLIVKAKQMTWDYKDDLVDTMSEYSYSFKNAWYTTSWMVQALVDAWKAWAFNFDYVWAAVQEFWTKLKSWDTAKQGIIRNIREATWDKTTNFEDEFAAWWERAEKSYQKLVVWAMSIKDENLRFQTLVWLYWTKAEDTWKKVIEALVWVDNSIETNKKFLEESVKAWEQLRATLESSPLQKVEALKQEFSQLAAESSKAWDFTESLFKLIEDHWDVVTKIFDWIWTAMSFVVDSISWWISWLKEFISYKESLLGSWTEVTKDWEKQSINPFRGASNVPWYLQGVNFWYNMIDNIWRTEESVKGWYWVPKEQSSLWFFWDTVQGRNKNRNEVTTNSIKWPSLPMNTWNTWTTVIIQGDLIADDRSLSNLKTRLDTAEKNLNNK